MLSIFEKKAGLCQIYKVGEVQDNKICDTRG
jgi:hypothetical protein